jgi:uncharacterized phage-associated protein
MHDDKGNDCSKANVDLIKDIIRTLAKRGVILTTTRIQKLFYLFERQCVIDIGKRCFNLDYQYDNYGMYSPNLREIMKHLDPEKDHLKIKEGIFEKGTGRTIGYIEGGKERPLPENVEVAVAKVVSEYGYLKTEVLIERAKSTSPFIYAKKGEKIDWKRFVEEQCEESEELSPTGIKRLQKAIDSTGYLAFDSVDEVRSYLFS